MADVRKVSADVPQPDPASFWMILFRALTDLSGYLDILGPGYGLAFHF